MYTLVIHVANEDAIMAEVEALPDPADVSIAVMNPRRRDGKDVHYVLPEVQMLIIPWWRINFIQVMPTGEEEDIVSPFDL